MHHLNARVLGLCLVVLSMAMPVFAQTSSATQTAPRTEISGGYQFVTFSVEEESESMPKGWYFDVTGNLTPMLGVVFQVGGNYKTFEESVTIGGGTFTASADLKVHEFLGGLRLSARQNPRLVPYGQVLAGGINGSIELTTTSTIPGVPAFSEEDSSTNFAIVFGGGVHFGVTDNTAIRFGVDYLRIFEEDAGSNVFRFQVGLVLGR
jgi:opacity protein-like surface antigen